MNPVSALVAVIVAKRQHQIVARPLLAALPFADVVHIGNRFLASAGSVQQMQAISLTRPM